MVIFAVRSSELLSSRGINLEIAHARTARGVMHGGRPLAARQGRTRSRKTDLEFLDDKDQARVIMETVGMCLPSASNG